LTTSPSAGSSSTTLPRAGSPSTTSPPPHVWVPRHIARLLTRLIAPLIIGYSASRRLVLDYFASAARLGASARRAARRRLLRLCRTFGCLGTSRGSSLVVDYFAYTVQPGASARRAARQRLVAPLVVDYSASRRVVVDNSASRRLVVDYFASARASGCLSTSRSSSCGSSRRSSSTTPPRAGSWSTTSPTPRGSSLVVDYFAYAVRPGASARRAARRVARCAARR
jgi:hypothetical protein